MPIRKRENLVVAPVGGPGPAETLQVDHDTLAEYLQHCKAHGMRDLCIQIPLAQAPKFGNIFVSIDELIKLVDRPLLTLPKETARPTIKLRPIKKLAKVTRNVRGIS